MSDYNDGLIPEPCLRLDYGFGQQYASVELGDGTGYVRVTDDLRGEYHKMERWYDDNLRAALDENAKLRKLVLYMWDFSCVVPDEPHTSKEELDYSVEVWKRMRELGVETDG